MSIEIIEVVGYTSPIAQPHTTEERDALTPTNGLIIYNSTDSEFNFYENDAWVTK